MSDNTSSYGVPAPPPPADPDSNAQVKRKDRADPVPSGQESKKRRSEEKMETGNGWHVVDGGQGEGDALGASSTGRTPERSAAAAASGGGGGGHSKHSGEKDPFKAFVKMEMTELKPFDENGQFTMNAKMVKLLLHAMQCWKNAQPVDIKIVEGLAARVNKLVYEEACALESEGDTPMTNGISVLLAIMNWMVSGTENEVCNQILQAMKKHGIHHALEDCSSEGCLALYKVMSKFDQFLAVVKKLPLQPIRSKAAERTKEALKAAEAAQKEVERLRAELEAAEKRVKEAQQRHAAMQAKEQRELTPGEKNIEGLRENYDKLAKYIETVMSKPAVDNYMSAVVLYNGQQVYKFVDPAPSGQGAGASSSGAPAP